MKARTWVAAVLAAASWAAPKLYERFELAAMGYAVKGVDVSHYQGDIDWRALRKSGVGFAYIKATEGANYRDPFFARNWRQSREAGVPRGAYHFFTLCKTGAEQAANFIATTPIEPGALPHALDAEQIRRCRTGKPISDPAAEIKVFLDLTERRYGRRPLIYTTRRFHETFLQGRLKKERFWLRNLFWTPRFRKKQWTLWQYHHRGRRPGVEGPVDLDAFNGSRADFESFASLQGGAWRR
jgi:lysozyme